MAESSECASISLRKSGHEPRRIRLKRYLVRKLALQKFGEVTDKSKTEHEDIPEPVYSRVCILLSW